MPLRYFFCCALSIAKLALSQRLYVSSYGGNVTTLDFKHRNDSCILRPVVTTNGCSPSPSWLELDHKTKTLYCVDEGNPTRNATVSSFLTTGNGTLVLQGKATTPIGGVSSVIFGNGTMMALAH